MNIHLTQKLREKFHTPELPVDTMPLSPHLHWYAHLFRANRAQFILTTNAASLYSVMMYGAGMTDEGVFMKQLLSELRDELKSDGLEFIFERCIAPYTKTVYLSRATDRRVLGSMNNMVQLCKHLVADRDAKPGELTQYLNRTPFSAIGHVFPKKEFAKLTPGTG